MGELGESSPIMPTRAAPVGVGGTKSQRKASSDNPVGEAALALGNGSPMRIFHEREVSLLGCLNSAQRVQTHALARMQTDFAGEWDGLPSVPSSH